MGIIRRARIGKPRLEIQLIPSVLFLADSPYCNPPRSPSSKKSGLVSAVTRATKSSKRSSNGDVKTMGGSAYVAFQLDFPVNYPFKAPKITVLSNSYHPNINTNTGEICDNMLTGEGWSPTINVRVGVCPRHVCPYSIV